jgi:hypothetical protein
MAGSGDEQAQAKLCRVETSEVAVALTETFPYRAYTAT